MKNLITILFFFLQTIASTKCLCQDHKVDSLRNQLITAKDDTNKVKIFNQLESHFFMSEPRKSFNYTKQELRLSQKINYKKGVIQGYQNIAGFYYHMGNLDSALYYTNEALPFIKETNDKKSLAATFQHLGTISFGKNDYVSALDYSNKGLQLATEIKDSNLISKILGVEGMVYTYMSNYPTAISRLLEAARISDAINDKVAIATAYWYLGHVYELEHSNDKAISYYELALKNATEVNDKFHTASSLAQLGEMCQVNKQWNKSLDYYKKAISIYDELGSNLDISSCIRSMAMIYSEYGKYDTAINLMNAAFKLSDKIGDKYEQCAGYGNMGEIYMKMKDYHTAIGYLNKGLNLAKDIKEKNDESCALDDLAKCYESLKDYTTAYEYSSQYNSVKDSILNNETIKKTAEMEALYNSGKSEGQIALLTKNSEIQKLQIKKQTLLEKSLVAGLVLMCILFFFVYRSYHNQQLLKLQTLRNKIASDLHNDIGSTLSSISIFTLMAKQGSKEVIPMLEQIGEYSRNMLESMADIVWNINPNNDNFEKIILRMRSLAFEMLGSKNIDFEFNTDESLNSFKLSMELRKNLYLIFKEATNNMVKYSQADSAMFSITRSKNILTLLIRDNGKGFDTRQESIGNGLKNMKSRAEEMGAKFFIESEPGKGTTVQLLIKAA